MAKSDDYIWLDYWCPTKEKWSMCPGPCPDGTPHGPSRPSNT